MGSREIFDLEFGRANKNSICERMFDSRNERISIEIYGFILEKCPFHHEDEGCWSPYGPKYCVVMNEDAREIVEQHYRLANDVLGDWWGDEWN